MSVSRVQTITADQQSGQVPSYTSAAFGSAVTVGNVVVVALSHYQMTDTVTVTVTDSKGNTYTLVDKYQDGTNRWVEVYKSIVGTGGTGLTITAAMDTNSYIGFAAAEYTGTDGTVPSHANGADAGSTSHALPSVTPSAAGDMIIGAGAASADMGSWTGASGSTVVTGSATPWTSETIVLLEKAATGTSADHTDVTSGGSAVLYGVSLVLKAGSSPPPPPPPPPTTAGADATYHYRGHVGRAG